MKEKYFGALILAAGILYLLSDLAKTFEIGVDRETVLLLLAGLWLVLRR